MLLTGPSAFAAFLALSDWLWQSTGKTSGLTPEMLVDALFAYQTEVLGLAAENVRPSL
ncbi:MAG: radical SAM family protein, partial [uncultured bacterium]